MGNRGLLLFIWSQIIVPLIHNSDNTILQDLIPELIDIDLDVVHEVNVILDLLIDLFINGDTVILVDDDIYDDLCGQC